MKISARWLVPAVVASVAVAACTGVEAPQATEGPDFAGAADSLTSYSLVPGVVVDVARDLVYVMRPGGGIEALDLGDGGVRWATEAADKPLFVAADVLVAQIETSAPGLAVAWLHPKTGALVAEPAQPLVLPLPAGVVAGIDQTLAASFRENVVDSGGEAFITWEYIERDVTGVSPPGGRAFARRETGAFRFRPETMDFETVAEESIPAKIDDWPSELRELVATRRVPGPPWRAGQVLAVTQQRYDPDELVLLRWRQADGERLEKVNIYSGRALAALGSCDEQHTVVAVRGSGASADPPYRLRFIGLETGELVSEIPSERSAGPFCLLGSRLLRLSQPSVRRVGDVLVESPLVLVTSDIESGAQVWRREVRDTAFRGPAPPRS